MYCGSCTAHCPRAVRQCIAGVQLPIATRRSGSALRECHCPWPPGGVAVHGRSCSAHCLHAVRQCIAGVAVPTAPWRCGSTLQKLHCPLPPCSEAVYCSWGDGESCPGGGCCLKIGPPAMHCHNAWAQWAVELMSCSASLPGGSGQWNSCNALPHCLGAVGSGTPATGSGTAGTHCLTAWGQWVVQCCGVWCVALCRAAWWCGVLPFIILGGDGEGCFAVALLVLN